MKMKNLDGKTNRTSQLILGVLLLLIVLGVLGKTLLANQPSKESDLPATIYVEKELQLMGVTRSPEYMYIWFRDPYWSERDYSKVTVYPYKKNQEMGESFVGRRDFRVYRIKAPKGFYSVKVDYDGTMFYLNEHDYEKIHGEDPTREHTILEYLRYMEEIYQKKIASFAEDKSIFITKKENLEKKNVELRSDQLFLTEEQKNKLKSDIENNEAEIEKHKIYLEKLDEFTKKYEEKIRLVQEEREFMNSGKVAPIEAPEEEVASQDPAYVKKAPQTFRFVFSHLDEKGNGVFEKYYTLDTMADYSTAQFYKTDLHGKFYVDFYAVEGDYIYLKQEKQFIEDPVDDTLRVIFINQEKGLFELSNVEMMKKTNLEITCVDASGNPLPDHKASFSVNKSMDDFINITTDRMGIAKLQNVDVSSNGIYYLQLEGATNTVELKAKPASLVKEEATFTFPPPKVETPSETPKNKERGS